VLALLAGTGLAGAGPADAAVMVHPAPHHARKTAAQRAAAQKAAARKAARKAAARKAAAKKAAAKKAAAQKAAAEQRAELAALARWAASAELSDVPKQYVRWYQAAARTCSGLSWTVLAGIGTIESDNGRSAARGVHSGRNYKGAEGPMQFEPGTFAEYKVRADKSHKLSPYDPVDAIYSAARMLCADGGGTAAGLHGAVFAYNHACWYVQDVLTIASRYAAQARPKTSSKASPKDRHKPRRAKKKPMRARKKQPAQKKQPARKKQPAERRKSRGGGQPAGAC